MNDRNHQKDNTISGMIFNKDKKQNRMEILNGIQSTNMPQTMERLISKLVK